MESSTYDSPGDFDFRSGTPVDASIETTRRVVHRCVLFSVVAIFFAGCGDADSPPEGWEEAKPMSTARGEVSAAVGQRKAGCNDPPFEVVAVVGGYGYPGILLRQIEW